jgi:Fe(3+) dicitrate transport protein
MSSHERDWAGVIFTNVALIKSNYKKSDVPGVTGNEVEFVPAVNLKTGIRLGYKNFKTSFQYTALTSQYSDATNATDGGVSAVVGLIPSYSIMDLSFQYTYTRFRVEFTVNNLANRMYFTRRATGYPGPGILPSDGRSFFVTLQVKI